jgi:hypothetical protein
MSIVLGIDAAWTDRHPSGVAVLDLNRPAKCLAVAPSYDSFIGLASGTAVDKYVKHSGSREAAG